MHRKTIYSFLLFLFVMLLQRISFSQEVPFLLKSDTVQPITAGEYCQFLNAVAATDLDHLYNEKMKSSCCNLILRTGEIGSYHYQVVAGNKEVSMTFMNKLHASYYLSWLQDPSLMLASTIPSMTCDEELQSMSSHFYFMKSSSLTSIQQSSDIEKRSFLENVVIGAAEIGVLLIAGREMTTRDIDSERGHLPLSYPHERLQEIEAASTGSLHEIKVAPVISEGKPAAFSSFKFKDFPNDILREAVFVFFSPKMPNELGGHYKQEYQKTLTALRTTDSNLAQKVIFWQEAYHAWSYAKGKQKITAYQRLQEIERNLPSNVHAITVFYRAGEVMDQFQSFQEKWISTLKVQKEQYIPYFLSGATKINDILTQAISNIRALIEVVQTCQQESEKEEVNQVSFIADQYKLVSNLAAHAINDYTLLARKIGTKDAQKIRSFLEKREHRQTMITTKLALCGSLLSYHQKMEHCREPLLQAGIPNDDVVKYLTQINFCFNKAIQATSCHAQILWVKEGDYYLQGVEELVMNGLTEKARNLSSAAFEARHAAEAFEKGSKAISFQVKMVFEQVGDYYLQSAEETAAYGVTEKVKKLNDAAFIAIGAVKVFEEATKATSSQAKMAFEQAGDYYLQKAKEIAINGFTEESENLNSIASAARKAGEAFEKVAKARSLQEKMIFEKEGEAHFQTVQDFENRNNCRFISRIINGAMKLIFKLTPSLI